MPKRRSWLKRLFHRRPKPDIPLWAKVMALQIVNANTPPDTNPWRQTRRGF